MDNANGLELDGPVIDPQETNDSISPFESINQNVDDIFTKVDQLEQKLTEVEQFYSATGKKQPNTPKGSSIGKDKDKEKFIAGFKKRQQDAALREAAAAKRMQELMRKCAPILSMITAHEWAGPFMQPVDVVTLGLTDYYEVIKKPMDFSTIQSKMEAKDGNGYKHVREICADVRLVFKNAMKYNDEKDDVHIMAKKLLDKFETKWLQLLPKVDEEGVLCARGLPEVSIFTERVSKSLHFVLKEKRLKQEAAELQHDIQLAQEVSHAKVARELNSDLEEVDLQLRELRELVLQNCRKMSTDEKKRIGSAITHLSPEDINKAIEIISQNEPDFQNTGDVVEINIDTQSESTLWKLKFFVREALQAKIKNAGGGANSQRDNNQNKRKKEICEALAKSSQKKSKR